MTRSTQPVKRLAIIGAGPSGLFLYQQLLTIKPQTLTVEIFEQKSQLGQGMPYSSEGSNIEHITNVSGNEIPELPVSLVDWIDSLPAEKLGKYNIDAGSFHEFKVLPRLLFGEYLEDQFHRLLDKSKILGLDTTVHLDCLVTDIIEDPINETVTIEFDDLKRKTFDQVIICTGHYWPLPHENKTKGYFDSPYPPKKLIQRFDHPVAVRGSSLTAIDAVRTIARSNGTFIKEETHKLSFIPDKDAPDFKIIMHSRNGLLPAIRFHLDDPRLSNDMLLTKEEIEYHRKENDGFLSLDFIFEKDFKEPFREKDPEFYQLVRNLNMEAFVEMMMNKRERLDPFLLFKLEYDEAKKSMKRRESVYWKEMLAVLSFAMNYPAKHFSAEDMLRLKKILMPLISIVIAFVPQSSCEEMIALHEAGLLDIISVGEENDIEIIPGGGIIYRYTDEETGIPCENSYDTFIDCIGQPHLSKNDFPFKTMVNNNAVTSALIRFRDSQKAKELLSDGNTSIKEKGNYFFLEVPGIAIDDNFRIINTEGRKSPFVHIMAVSYIGGFNPDYSGLDFCEEASNIIVKDIFKTAEINS